MRCLVFRAADAIIILLCNTVKFQTAPILLQDQTKISVAKQKEPELHFTVTGVTVHSSFLI